MTTETTTGERIVVIPEITVTAAVRDAGDEVKRLTDKLMPELEELRAAAEAVRDAHDQVLVALYPHIGTGYDEVHEIAGRVTGWDDAWGVVSKIGDMFGPDVLFNGGLHESEIARGGERNITHGTYARVIDPDGNPVRVMVERAPTRKDGTYTVVNAADLATRYTCSHDELKAGLEQEAEG